MIKYKNLRFGKEIEITADQFKKYLVPKERFEKDFFIDDSIGMVASKKVTNSLYLYTIKFKDVDKLMCVLWGTLKNSGTEGNDHKRMQVSKNVELQHGIPHVAIGAYDAGDNIIYTAILKGIPRVIIDAKCGSSYSSLWLDYPSICETYKKEYHSWVDGRNRDVVACTDKKIDVLLNTLKELVSHCNSIEINEKEMNDGKMPELVEVDKKNLSNYKVDSDLPRNPSYRDMVFKREDGTCELCGTRSTFVDRNNEQYFEAHHLIMYNLNTQKRYRYSLDHPSNMICLCPNCHRKIHQSSKEVIKEYLIDLFTKHNDLLKIYEIDDLASILNDYISNG